MLAAQKKSVIKPKKGYKDNENNLLNIQYIASPTASWHMCIISNEDPEKQTL